MSDQVQVMVLHHNIFLQQPGDREAVQFFKGESVMLERDDAQAIIDGDDMAERDRRIAIVEAPQRKAVPSQGDDVQPKRGPGRPRKDAA